MVRQDRPSRPNPLHTRAETGPAPSLLSFQHRGTLSPCSDLLYLRDRNSLASPALCGPGAQEETARCALAMHLEDSDRFHSSLLLSHSAQFAPLQREKESTRELRKRLQFS